MYSVDDLDQVIELAEFPFFDSGAPCVRLISTEHGTLLTYVLAEPFDSDSAKCQIAFVHFDGASFCWGELNDEVLNAHPLHKRGLGYYSVYEVKNSSWIRQLERMNSVHPRHDPQRFAPLRHVIFTFKDELFECVTLGWEIRVETIDFDKMRSRFIDEVIQMNWPGRISIADWPGISQPPKEQ